MHVPEHMHTLDYRVAEPAGTLISFSIRTPDVLQVKAGRGLVRSKNSQSNLTLMLSKRFR